MYKTEGRVTFSQSRGDGNMSIPSMMYFMQDCVNLHARDIGRGLEYLDEKRRLWAITCWNMKIIRRPHAGERIVAGTYSSGVRSMLANREFVIESESGEKLAIANSQWIYMDMDTRKPTRIREDDMLGYELGESLEGIDKPNHKIIFPDGEWENMGQIPILRHFLDVNGHLNNISYVFLAMEYIPREFEITDFKTVYKKESYQGDKVYVKMLQIGDEYYFDFVDDEEDSRFSAYFKGYKLDEVRELK